MRPIVSVVVAISEPELVLAEIRPVEFTTAQPGTTNGTLNAPLDDALNVVTAAPLKVSFPDWPAAKPVPLTAICCAGRRCRGR